MLSYKRKEIVENFVNTIDHNTLQMRVHNVNLKFLFIL